MKPLGIDIGVLRGGDEMRTPFVHPTCPGARVWVNREGLGVMKAGGEVFIDGEIFVPKDGYGAARVRCGRPVDAKVGTAGHVIYFGLCNSCSGAETDNRETLRKRSGSRSEL